MKLCPVCKQVKPVTEYHNCQRGRDGLNYTCKQCVKAYQDANREQRLTQKREYYARMRDAIRRDKKAYRDTPQGKTVTRAYSEAYYEANREEILKKKRQYRDTPQGMASTRAYNQQYFKENREIKHAKDARRKMRIRGTTKMSSEDRVLSTAYRKAIRNDPCFYCGAPGKQDDHWMPLAKGGTDHWWNLVRACAPCNNSKHARCGDHFIEGTSCPCSAESKENDCNQ